MGELPARQQLRIAASTARRASAVGMDDSGAPSTKPTSTTKRMTRGGLDPGALGQRQLQTLDASANAPQDLAVLAHLVSFFGVNLRTCPTAPPYLTGSMSSPSCEPKSKPCSSQASRFRPSLRRQSLSRSLVADAPRARPRLLITSSATTWSTVKLPTKGQLRTKLRRRRLGCGSKGGRCLAGVVRWKLCATDQGCQCSPEFTSRELRSRLEGFDQTSKRCGLMGIIGIPAIDEGLKVLTNHE